MAYQDHEHTHTHASNFSAGSTTTFSHSKITSLQVGNKKDEATVRRALTRVFIFRSFRVLEKTNSEREAFAVKNHTKQMKAKIELYLKTQHAPKLYKTTERKPN